MGDISTPAAPLSIRLASSETTEQVKSFRYLGSMLTEDGNDIAQVMACVDWAWNNHDTMRRAVEWKRMKPKLWGEDFLHLRARGPAVGLRALAGHIGHMREDLQALLLYAEADGGPGVRRARMEQGQAAGQEEKERRASHAELREKLAVAAVTGRHSVTLRLRPMLITMIVAGRLDPDAYPAAPTTRPRQQRPLDFLSSCIHNIDKYTTKEGTRAATTAFNRAQLRGTTRTAWPCRGGRRLWSGPMCGP